jgi:hypothetical protein
MSSFVQQYIFRRIRLSQIKRRIRDIFIRLGRELSEKNNYTWSGSIFQRLNYYNIANKPKAKLKTKAIVMGSSNLRSPRLQWESFP